MVADMKREKRQPSAKYALVNRTPKPECIQFDARKADGVAARDATTE
jgi:hypothetical protein